MRGQWDALGKIPETESCSSKEKNQSEQVSAAQAAGVVRKSHWGKRNHLKSEVLSVTRVAGVSINVKKTTTYGVVRYISSWCVLSKFQEASQLSRGARTASISVDAVIRTDGKRICEL